MNPDKLPSISRLLTKELATRDMSQRSLAKLIGLSNSQVSRLIRNNHPPKRRTLMLLSKYFKLPYKNLAISAAIHSQA